ncbi:MAG: methyltransferase domain-containing protein [Myxococcota bacterium]
MPPTIPTDLRQHLTRVVDVEVTPAVTLKVREVLYQRRPNHWSRVWPSALALSRWLVEQPRLPDRARELGCGVGVVSLTLARLGVQVEGTDREPLALAFALRNARENDVTGLTVRHLDWREPEGEPSDFIVASDILYEPEAPALVFHVIHTAGLLSSGGRFILAGPRARPVPVQEFIRRLHDEGYTHHEELRSVEWEGRVEEIEIHELQRPTSHTGKP